MLCVRYRRGMIIQLRMPTTALRAATVCGVVVVCTQLRMLAATALCTAAVRGVVKTSYHAQQALCRACCARDSDTT